MAHPVSFLKESPVIVHKLTDSEGSVYIGLLNRPYSAMVHPDHEEGYVIRYYRIDSDGSSTAYFVDYRKHDNQQSCIATASANLIRWEESEGK